MAAVTRVDRQATSQWQKCIHLNRTCLERERERGRRSRPTTPPALEGGPEFGATGAAVVRAGTERRGGSPVVRRYVRCVQIRFGRILPVSSPNLTSLLLHRKGKLGTVDRETSDKMAEDDPVMETEAEVGGGVMLGWTA